MASDVRRTRNVTVLLVAMDPSSAPDDVSADDAGAKTGGCEDDNNSALIVARELLCANLSIWSFLGRQIGRMKKKKI
jgi:hypothetical protein